MRTLTFENVNGQSITFSDFPYFITGHSGLDSPPLYIQTKTAPFQDGSTLIDQLYGPRDITIECAISSAPMSTSLQAAARRNIVTALNPKHGEGRLLYTNDIGTWQIYAIPVSSPTFAFRDSTEPYQRFQVAFNCPDPFWQSITENTQSFEYLGTELEFPIEFNPTIKVSELGSIAGYMADITNDGDVACPVVVRFYGPATNPKIMNNTTGEFIRIIRTLLSTDYIEVCTSFGNKRVTLDESGTQTSAMQFLDLNSAFFQLQPGVNNIEFQEDGLSAGSSASIAYRKRYIGV